MSKEEATGTMIDDGTYRQLRVMRTALAAQERIEAEQQALRDFHEQERLAGLKLRPPRRRPIGRLKTKHMPRG